MHTNGGVKSIVCAKKIIVGILAHVFVRMVSILKSIGDSSVVMCDKIINATDSVSTIVTNTIPTNMTNTIYSKCLEYCH